MSAWRGVRATFVPLLASALLAAPVIAETERSQIDLARGIEFINAGKFQEALEPLARTLAADPTDQEALYYGGLAQARLGEYEAAADLFARALALEENAEVILELGRVRALTDRCDEARRLFARYEALGADETGIRSIEGLLLGCGGERERLPLRLAVTAGWQHDSNVILAADQPTSPEPTQADQRGVLYLTAAATPLRTRHLELELGYSFYGNLHDKLDEYDAIVNRVTTKLGVTSWAAVRPVLGYAFEYTHFGGAAYSRVHRGSLQLEVREGAHAATEIVIEVRDARYWDSQSFPGSAERSGDGESGGLRQRISAGTVELTVSLFGDRDRARAPWWDSEAWRAGAQLTWRPTPALAIGLSGEYLERDYADPFAGQQEARADRTQTYGATISRSFGRAVTLTLAGSRTRNESNLEYYQYTRTIVGIYLTFGWGS